MVNRCLPAPSTAFLEIEDSKAGSFGERMASHTHLSHLMSRSSFCGRTLYRRTKILVAAPSGRCTGGGFINEVLVAQSVCAAGRPPNVIYGTTGPRDCCTIVLSRHVQLIANNKIYHALLSSGFLFSSCYCWETVAAKYQ